MADAAMLRGPSVAVGINRGLDYIRTNYLVRESEQVESYLRLYPILIDALVDARPLIARYFGEQTKVELDVVDDPESADTRELYAVIRSPYEPTETLDRLAHLDDEWLPKTPPEILERLVISIGHASRV